MEKNYVKNLKTDNTINGTGKTHRSRTRELDFENNFREESIESLQKSGVEKIINEERGEKVFKCGGTLVSAWNRHILDYENERSWFLKGAEAQDERLL